jgi:hypothetical protein
METIGDNIYVNIKELPSIEEVQPGDYLIIETDTGTNICDFVNFILPPENVTFYGEIENLQTDVLILSSAIQTTNTTVSSLSSQLNTTVNSTVTSVNTQIANLSNTYTDWFTKGSITFNGATSGVTQGNRCTANRISTGVYQITFPNTNITAANVSSNANIALVTAVTNSGAGGIAIINTYTIPTSSTAYAPVLADVSLISVIGA